MEMDNKLDDKTMDSPPDFRCPISMEIMEDPVTISTGITYERTNIEKWFFKYNMKACPTTMQTIETFHITPNHNLKRLILAWQKGKSQSSPPRLIKLDDELVSLLATIESTPFKVNPLKKLQSILETRDEATVEFQRSGGVEVLFPIVVQILVESADFNTFRACEEALGVLHKLSFCEETMQLLSKQEMIISMAIMLQRGSAEARFYSVSIFQKIAKSNSNLKLVIEDQDIDLFKSLLELVSDEIYTKASSYALEVLIVVLDLSKKSRLKAIEAGAICILIELLPDSNKSKCEKVMVLIKLLCKCAEGRLAFTDHELGLAAVSEKMLCVSEFVTKIGVKIMWVICSSHPNERVLEEMLVFGAVKKLVALLNISGRSSTKSRVLKIMKLHGNSWRRYPCFPCELKDYLGLGIGSF